MTPPPKKKHGDGEKRHFRGHSRPTEGSGPATTSVYSVSVPSASFEPTWSDDLSRSAMQRALELLPATVRFDLSPENLGLLLRGGLPALSARRKVSERTLRRRFATQGAPISTVTLSSRRAGLLFLLHHGTSARLTAEILGFAGPATMRRFAKRELGSSWRALRGSLRG